MATGSHSIAFDPPTIRRQARVLSVRPQQFSGRKQGCKPTRRWRTRRLSRLPSGVLYLRLRAGLRFKPLQELAKAFLPIGLRFDQDRQQRVLFRRIDPHAV
jgi:hypothetical protein